MVIVLIALIVLSLVVWRAIILEEQHHKRMQDREKDMERFMEQFEAMQKRTRGKK